MTYSYMQPVVVWLVPTDSAGGLLNEARQPHDGYFLVESHRSPGFVRVMVGEATLTVPAEHVRPTEPLVPGYEGTEDVTAPGVPEDERTWW